MACWGIEAVIYKFPQRLTGCRKSHGQRIAYITLDKPALRRVMNGTQATALERKMLHQSNQLDAAIRQLASMAAVPVELPEGKTGLESLNGMIDIASTIYASKLHDYFSGVKLGLDQELFVVAALCCRAAVEHIAVMHHLVEAKELMAVKVAWEADTLQPEMLNGAVTRLHRFTHGNSFAWDAWIDGNAVEIQAEARPMTGTPAQVRVGREAMKTLNKVWPPSKALYNILTDMSHPNLGGNLLVMGTGGGASFGGVQRHESARTQALKVVSGTLVCFMKFVALDLETLVGFKLKSKKAMAKAKRSVKLLH